jgi:hypothetical protein
MQSLKITSQLYPKNRADACIQKPVLGTVRQNGTMSAFVALYCGAPAIIGANFRTHLQRHVYCNLVTSKVLKR